MILLFTNDQIVNLFESIGEPMLSELADVVSKKNEIAHKQIRDQIENGEFNHLIDKIKQFSALLKESSVLRRFFSDRYGPYNTQNDESIPVLLASALFEERRGVVTYTGRIHQLEADIRAFLTTLSVMPYDDVKEKIEAKFKIEDYIEEIEKQ